MLVLPETDAASAERVAERCRNLVFKEQITHGSSQVAQILTISMGLGTIVPTQKDETRSFIDAVDRNLYLAKQRGRNQLVSGLD